MSKSESAALVRDPEIAAIDKIDRVVRGLKENAQTRVIAWLVAKYVPGRFRMEVVATPESQEQGK